MGSRVFSVVLSQLHAKISRIKLLNVDDGSMKQREHLTRRKTKLELIRICAVVAGIELSYAAETAFVSPIMLRMHMPHAFMTLTWCLSPLLGLLLTPLLGSLSDRCSSALGRRRPFLISFSVIIVAGLALVANSHDLGNLIGDSCRMKAENITIFNSSGENTSTEVKQSNEKINNCIWGIVFAVIGVMFLDFSCDASQSPARTYLLDICVPEDHKAGLTMFTVVSGVGGALGYILGAINWNIGDNNGEAFMSHVRVIFLTVLVLLVILVTISVTSFSEVPLSEINTTKLAKNELETFKYKEFTNEESPEEDTIADVSTSNHNTSHISSNVSDNRVTEDETRDITTLQVANEELSLRHYLLSIIHLPKSIAILCLTNLFSWMSLLCYSLYFTDFVAQTVFGGVPTAPNGSRKQVSYTEGIRFGSGSMALYSITCSLYSLTIESLIVRFGTHKVYVLSILTSMFGMLLLSFIPSKATVLVTSASMGIIYAALFSIPYIIIANYHSNNEFSELVSHGSHSNIRGLGTDVAIVGSMVFVGQLLLSVCMGPLVHAVGSNVVIAYCSVILSFLAAASTFGITYGGH